MCSHYQTLKDAELLLKKFGAPNKPAGGKYDMWPRYPGIFIRRPVEHDALATRRCRSAKRWWGAGA